MSTVLIPKNVLLSGAKECTKNGLRLRWDAEILFARKQYESAHVLAIFAIEEFGKAAFLAQKYHQGQNVTKKKYDDIFIKHPAKIAFQLQQTVGLLEEKYQEQERAWFLQMAKYEHQRKLRSIYVDWLDGKWSVPTEGNLEERKYRAFDAKKTASFSWYLADQTLKGRIIRAKKSTQPNQASTST